MKFVESGETDFSLIGFTWDVITSCQYRCSYCYALEWLTSPKKLENTTAYKHVLPRLKLNSMPNFKIELLGGEPMLHPHIDEIISGLTSNDNCVDLTLNTNMVLPIDKLSDFADQGLNISGSYHPEQNRDVTRFCNQIVSAHKNGFTGKRLLVNINIHRDPKYIKNYVDILRVCGEYNIFAGANYLFSTKSYDCSLTESFANELYESVSKLETIPPGWDMEDSKRCGVSIHRHPGQAMIKFMTTDGNITHTNAGDVFENKLNRFKGWNCRPKLWQINSNGHIFNDCTKESLLLDNSNINGLRTCPNQACGDCEVKFRYHKTAPGRQPPVI